MKKAFASNAKAIENRIAYFKREEEKIWKDLEEVRRQASKIEDGRSRIIEKRIADESISSMQEQHKHTNSLRARDQKARGESARAMQAHELTRQKKVAGMARRQEAAEMLRHKRMMDAQHRLRNSERAVAVQRQQLEAKLKANQQRANRLAHIREEQESSRRDAETSVRHVEERLPMLEAEELLCVQRLTNSRIVTQSVLRELEQSLGARSPVASLLRSKTQQRSIPERPMQDLSASFEADGNGRQLSFQDSMDGGLQPHDLPATLDAAVDLGQS